MTTNENTKNKGLAAQTANPNAKTTKPKFTDNSAFNQRLKLLDWLFESGSITTSEAREHLDIMSPAPRIMELKRNGYLIATIADNWTSQHGIKHKGIARYVLTQKQPIELANGH
jgi:hypothetical protein